MSNINIEAILLKHLRPLNLACITHDLKAMPDLKAAIREILEDTVDKCAEKAKTRGFAIDDGSDSGGTAIGVDKDSILNVKKMEV